jgi:hypothetical protein
MASPASQVVDGYAQLASELVERWSDHASTIAAKVKTGHYGIDDAVGDLATTTFIAGQSCFFVAAETLDAIAILSGTQREPPYVESRVYTSPLPGATLALTRALTSGSGDTVPNAAVTLLPATLGATGCRGARYRGEVTATDDGSPPATIVVGISIP